jgi:two-component system capsular synthesis response regulator RcsB
VPAALGKATAVDWCRPVSAGAREAHGDGLARIAGRDQRIGGAPAGVGEGVQGLLDQSERQRQHTGRLARVCVFPESLRRVKQRKGICQEDDRTVVQGAVTVSHATSVSASSDRVDGCRTAEDARGDPICGRRGLKMRPAPHRGDAHGTRASLAMIRVALLDDHPAVLAGLRRLLDYTAEIDVLAAAADEVELARALGTRRADVLIVDYDLARGDALALCRRIKARPEPLRVLVYSAYASPALAIAARVAQADGVLNKADPATALVETIRRIAHGETLIPDVAPEDLAAAAARVDDADLPIFAMLVDGEPLDMIAETLGTDQREIARRAGKLVGRLRPRLAQDARMGSSRAGSS